MLQRIWYPSSLCCLLLLPLLLLSSASVPTNPYYVNCSEHLHCGKLSKINVTYPFRLLESPNFCGYPGYELNCKLDDETIPLTIKLGGEDYGVHDIDYEYGVIIVVYSYFVRTDCPSSFTNTTINSTLFNYATGDSNLTVYLNCSFPIIPPQLSEITCLNNLSRPKTSYYKVDDGPSTFQEYFQGSCDHTAAMAVYEKLDFDLALKAGFGLTWSDNMNWCQECMQSGGRCGYNETRPEDHTCFCSDTIRLNSCFYSTSKRNKSLVIGVTKSFSEKLGQGGYGTVFKGEFPDGRLVAVKVLSDTKGNGDEFINEVASIGRTSHVNVVSLLGFSSEGSKRALIYEFMSNGSLEKYIHSENLKFALGWEKIYQIVVGIAHGLEYLHRGCKTRIVHFDIKPHNILLDQDFCPKISDFGLAQLCLKKDSIFSAIEARGTIGYIAPEVFSRNFGVVSSKSDVYSYGMMILEIVGVRNTSHSCNESDSDYYFPHWIYEHYHQIGHMEGFSVPIESEEIVKKMILVGLWCIQTNPGSRPSMSKVVDMLQCSIDDLEMPPKPTLSSA